MKRRGGLRGLYYSYCFKLKIFQKSKTSFPKFSFALREDLTKIDRYAKEARLLSTHHIDTGKDLASFSSAQESELEELSGERQKLRNKVRRAKEPELPALKNQITALTREIGKCRKNIKLCEDIQARSLEREKRLNILQESKEAQKHEHRRRRGGTDRQA